MIQFKIFSIIGGVCMFLPVEIVAYERNIQPASIVAMTYKTQTVGNHLKFKRAKDGTLLVNSSYDAPLQEELQDLYYIALQSTPTTLTLAKELSKIANTLSLDEKPATLYRYLHRFRFAQVSRALEVKKLLKLFIQKNNLFEELS